MIKRIFLIGTSVLLLVLPLTGWAENIAGKVYESGANNTPIAVSGVKVEVFGGYGFKALLSSTETGGNGGCLLQNVPLGKEVLVRLTKTGYVPQYDIRSYSDVDVEQGVILWIGSELNVEGLYKNLGEAFDVKKGHVYLEISNEVTGEGIEGVQFAVSSGKVFDLGQGEYLIANAEGALLKIEIQKPGYAFDIEFATIPLFSGAFTQYYIKVQSGGAIFASTQVMRVTSACITGFIKRLSDAGPISGVSVAFTRLLTGETVRPTVMTNSAGAYGQCGFQVWRWVRVTPTRPPWDFRPPRKDVFVGPRGATANFDGR